MIIKLYDEERVDEITASLMELGVRYKMQKEMDKREMNTVIYVASQGHKLEMHIQTDPSCQGKIRWFGKAIKQIKLSSST